MRLDRIIYLFLLIEISIEDKISLPILPERYFTNFTLYYTSRDDQEMPIPPWPKGYPPQEPYVVGRGATWYAWDLQIAIEFYQDFCVPIYNPPPYFPCIIFNFKSVAYLITPDYINPAMCCIYRPEWSMPHRDFMRPFTDNYTITTEGFGEGVLNQKIDWWIIPNESDSDDPRHRYFGGYGWAREKLRSGFNVPVDFWYEGTIGWAQQIFYNFVEDGPRTRDLEEFKLPEICFTNLTCLFPP